MPTTATPNILKDPGYLFWAPLGTSLPTNTVSGSKFTDSWNSPWVGLGATAEGSTIAYELKLEAISVAEFFDPIQWVPTERTGSIAMALADVTLTKLKYAFNGGTQTIVSGTGATQLNKLSPPDNTQIVRAMIGWESLDGTMRAFMYQTINGAKMELAFKKAPDNTTIPVEFNFEVPSGLPPLDFYTAGTARA